MAFFKYDGTLAAVTADATNGFYSTSAAETLTGTVGNDSLWGGDGDLLRGGAGDDIYTLGAGKIRVEELAGSGTDKIAAWSNIYLDNYANIENLQVYGGGLYGAGNGGDNVVEGDAGSQQLYGGGGQDVLVGGGGADTFLIVKGQGNDVIQDFSSDDVLRLSAGYSSFTDVLSHMTQVGSDVKLDLGGTDGVILRNTTTASFTAANFQLQLDTTKLGTMTFDDEFSSRLSLWDKESNPTGVWRPDFGYSGTQGVGSYTLQSNGEKQIYTSPYFRDHNGDFAESPFVSNADGTLSIWAKPSTNSEIFGYGYTSGLITTAQSFSQTYGYFEMRADLPSTAGAWPAFWLLPADGTWPPELDVMETLSVDPHAAHTTEHSNVGGVHTQQGYSAFVPDTADGFHTYGVLWTAKDLNWYVDGVEVFHTATPTDMNKPMYMLANMALGGWGGAIDNAAMPAEMKIDYIRAYALPGATTTTTTPPPTTTYSSVTPATVFSLPVSATPTQTISGNGAANNLTGTSGADLIDGGRGVDTMTGGAGDDTYIVENAGDKVVEAANGGIDTVKTGLASYTLASNAENLVLTGSKGQVGIGNELNNLLTANASGASLQGGAGNDVLVAGAGADTLTGGGGNDVFDFDKLTSSVDKITDFVRGQDVIDLRGILQNYQGSNPVADGWVSFQTNTAGTTILVDLDGAGTASALAPVVLLSGVTEGLTAQTDWIFH